MYPKMESGTNTKSVIQGFNLIKIISEIIAVNDPPTNCTKPVPIKFLTPSTSLIILDTKAPDFVLSKKLIGKDSTFFCTWARNSLIKYWACTLKILTSKNEVVDCMVTAAITIPIKV